MSHDMTDRRRSDRRSPIACAASACVVLVSCLAAGAALALSFDPLDNLDKGDALIVNLYGFGLALVGVVAAGIARALRLISKNWMTAGWVLLALAGVLVAYRFFSY